MQMFYTENHPTRFIRPDHLNMSLSESSESLGKISFTDSQDIEVLLG